MSHTLNKLFFSQLTLWMASPTKSFPVRSAEKIRKYLCACCTQLDVCHKQRQIIHKSHPACIQHEGIMKQCEWFACIYKLWIVCLYLQSAVTVCFLRAKSLYSLWNTNFCKWWQFSIKHIIMKGQSEIAYLPKFANIMLIVMVIVINEIF